MANRKVLEAGSTSDFEKRILAFAEQIGLIAGTVQAKTEGWLDRDKLNAQLASIRDSASDLLEEIGTSKPVAAMKRGVQMASDRASAGAKTSKRPAASRARPSAAGRVAGGKKGRGRSGGVVDAPGKKHRGPVPSASAAPGKSRGEGSRLAKLKVANMNRTQRRG